MKGRGGEGGKKEIGMEAKKVEEGRLVLELFLSPVCTLVRVKLK